MIKILIVDDDQTNAEIVRQSISEKWPSAVVEIETIFSSGTARLSSFRPDAIILDLYQGKPGEHVKEGQPIWDDVWLRHFAPIIIHSAGEVDLTPPLPEDHPFVKVAVKGKDSDKTILGFLEGFLPHITALNTIRDEFGSILQKVLKDTSAPIWKSQANNVLRDQMLLRTARRYAGALMDMKTLNTSEDLVSWEQFIYPPLEDQLLMGDILFEKGKGKTDPSAYYLILTPSCDMRKPTATSATMPSILVSQCGNVKDYLKACGLNEGTAADKYKSRLKTSLTQAQTAGYILIPELPSVIPPLAVNLKKLTLMPMSDIDIHEQKTGKYTRVISIDSPFREQIAWAYLQISGRPGMPSIDLDKWIGEILASIGVS